MSKLTIANVRNVLALVGVTIRKDSAGDYVVRVKGSPAGEGYFTSDLEDALVTGQVMSKTKRTPTGNAMAQYMRGHGF